MPYQDPNSHDGYIFAEFSAKPVPYHVSSVCGGDVPDAQCHQLAMSSCRIACITADVIRGRRPVDQLRRAASATCMRKLKMMAYLIDTHMMSHPDLKTRFCFMPVVPLWLNCVFTSPDDLESAAQLSIGGENYLVNLKLNRHGSVWRCIFADMG